MKIIGNAGYDVILMTSQEELRRYRYKENLLFRKLCSEGTFMKNVILSWWFWDSKSNAEKSCNGARSVHDYEC